jgi:hypothetical protein
MVPSHIFKVQKIIFWLKKSNQLILELGCQSIPPLAIGNIDLAH